MFTSFGKLEFNSQESLFSYEEIKRNPFTQSTNPKTKTKSIHDINENGQVFCKRSITNQPFFPSLFCKMAKHIVPGPTRRKRRIRKKKKIFHTFVKLYALNHILFFPFQNLCKSDYLSRFSILLSYLGNAFSKSYLFFTACQVVILY